jgi:hypothetical protein
MTPQKLAWERKWHALFNEAERRVERCLKRWGKVGIKFQKEKVNDEEILWTVSVNASPPTQIALLLREKGGRHSIALITSGIAGYESIERLHRDMAKKWAAIDDYLERGLMRAFLQSVATELQNQLGCTAFIPRNYAPQNGLPLCVYIGDYLIYVTFRLGNDGTFRWVVPHIGDYNEWHISGGKNDSPVDLLATAIKALHLSVLL